MENNDVNIKQSKIKSLFVGFVLGLAVIIPGVSAGTIAILFRVYDKIISAIDELTKKFKTSILFLLPIGVGIVVGFILGFISVKLLLDIAMFIVVAVFAGLMIGSVPDFVSNIPKTDKKRKYLLFIIGLIVPILLTTCSILFSINNEHLLVELPIWFYFVAFIIGIVLGASQIIPGMSATTILMMLGLFKAIMNTFSFTYWKDNPMIIVFYLCLIFGALLGVLLVSKVINKLLEKHKSSTYYLLFGFMISSIVSMFYNTEIINEVYVNWVSNSADAILNLSIGIPLFFLSAVGVILITNHVHKKNIEKE